MGSLASFVSHGGGAASDSAVNQRGLFLKVFSGEVLRAFERQIKVSPLITGRTITSGKSAQFPTTGVAAARYFTPGENLFEPGAVAGQSEGDGSTPQNYLSKLSQSERVIHIDELLTASCFIDDLDEAMSHYDYRSIFARELGNALARHQDQYALYTLIASAYNVGQVSGESTPTTHIEPVVDADFLTSASSAVDTIYDAAKALDEKDVPKEDRCVLLNPDGYYNLLKAGVLSANGAGMPSDPRPRGFDTFSTAADGAITSTHGPRAEGNMSVAGMPVVVTNAAGLQSHAMIDSKGGDTVSERNGSRNIADEDGVPNGQVGGTMAGGNTAAALVFHKSAAGMVKLKDVTMESEYIIERQGTLMVAKLATGMGALRNDAVALIRTA